MKIFRFHLHEHTFMVIIAVIIGALAGFGAIFFRFAIKFFQKLFFGSFHYSLDYVLSLPWYVKLISPCIGGLIVGPIVYYFAREAKGHGVPEVMEAIALRGGVIRPRVLIAKVIASAVCIGSGGSVGREGPIVQIGSALGSTIGQFLKLTSTQLRTLVACGAAGGIAGTFNAPIAGALFSMEVILGDFGISQFSPIVVSSVSATVVSRHFLGNFPAFIVPKYEMISVFELIPYTLLGICGGIVALSYMKFLYKMENTFEKINCPGILKPAIGGLIIGFIGLKFPHIFGVGYDTISLALMNKLTWYFLLFFLILKIISTSITIGSGGSGGVFAPSLFIGANLGGFLGYIFHHFFPDLTANPGAYALVGMGSVASGAMHAPITAIVIIFELTNNYTIIIPLMLSCIISVLITTRIQKESIYTMKLARRGIDLSKGHELNILKSLKVEDVMKEDFIKVSKNTNLKELMDLIVRTPYKYFYVVDNNKKVIGFISINHLRTILYDTRNLETLIVAYDIMSPVKKVFRKKDTLDAVMKAFGDLNVDELPVVNDLSKNELIGIITKDDVISAYNQEIFKRDTLHTFSGYLTSISHFEDVELSSRNEVLSQFEIPGKFVGKTIRELNISQRYKIEIILVKKKFKDDFKVIIPNGDYLFERGDIVLAIGRRKDLQAFRE